MTAAYLALALAAVGFLSAIALAVAWTADLLNLIHEQEEASRACDRRDADQRL